MEKVYEIAPGQSLELSYCSVADDIAQCSERRIPTLTDISRNSSDSISKWLSKSTTTK